MFPDAREFAIHGGCFNEAQTLHLDQSTKFKFNIVIVSDDQTKLAPLLDEKKWEKLISRANILVAERNGIDIMSESDEPPIVPGPEPPLRIPQPERRLLVYTGVDIAMKKLKRSIDVIFTLTPVCASDKPWPTIVWKALHFEKTTTAQTQIIWSSQAGFCVIKEADDGTLKPGDLRTQVEPGYAGVLQSVDNSDAFYADLETSFENNIAVCNVTGVRRRLALCTLDPTKPPSDQFCPVVDLQPIKATGKDAFACGRPVMLQAYVVPGYQERKPVDVSKLLRPLFVDPSTKKPEPMDVRKLSEMTTFRLYSNNSGTIVLEQD